MKSYVFACVLISYSEFKMGSQVDDQQVSCLWQGSYLLSVSLSGYINYLDVNNPDKPLRILKVHNTIITLPVSLSPQLIHYTVLAIQIPWCTAHQPKRQELLYCSIHKYLG